MSVLSGAFFALGRLWRRTPGFRQDANARDLTRPDVDVSAWLLVASFRRSLDLLANNPALILHHRLEVHRNPTKVEEGSEPPLGVGQL